MASTTKRPHVLIVGAGLGGMCLAQALRKQGITSELFERDAAIHSRFQGWAIALHLMLQDFKASMPDDLGPVDKTNHLLPLDLPAQFTLYRDGKPLVQATSDEEHQIIRSNRGKLRDYLSANLNITWGKTFSRIEEHENSVTLHFDDGTSATGDVLVGADGVNSHVRSYLYDGKDLLRTIPSAYVIGQVRLNKEEYERQLSISHSAYVLISGKDRMFVGLNAIGPNAEYGDYYWMYVFTDPSPETREWTYKASKQELHDVALEKVKIFGPRLSEIVRLTKSGEILTPPLEVRDIELESMPNKRITLLGDAAHAMAPNRGEGGNHALQDSLNLARAIAKSEPDTLLHLLKEYQDEMLERGQNAMRKSREASSDDGSGTAAGWNRWGKPVQVPVEAPVEIAVEAN